MEIDGGNYITRRPNYPAELFITISGNLMALCVNHSQGDNKKYPSDSSVNLSNG